MRLSHRIINAACKSLI